MSGQHQAVGALQNEEAITKRDAAEERRLRSDVHGLTRAALEKMPMSAPVGDLNSDAKGTGARFNAGKAPYDLVPIKVMAETILRSRPDSTPAKALFLLGCYQSTRDISWLYAMVDELGLEGWEECAAVFQYGKAKYAAWNWSKGMSWSVPVACIARHLHAMLAGATLDDESKLPHRGHVFCNICMLVTYSVTYAEGDDLPPAGALA